MGIHTVSVHQLAERQATEELDVIDVRTPLEFRSLHAVVARNVPLDVLDPHAVMKERKGPPDQPLYLICRSGSRAAMACQKFIAAGYANVVNVDGGTTAWSEAGLPVNRGKNSLSLERQVRIAAGLIVLTGGLLALLALPPLSTIGAVVASACGAGLAFAGITDSCMMGMLLAKMPWNQVAETGSCCSKS
ncbi:MAG: rhodanese-like domain-containing protein [Planctomycetales bacterium]|nr:rhodanese-like domain-containing protein [Planctomycetales bacterium]